MTDEKTMTDTKAAEEVIGHLGWDGIVCLIHNLPATWIPQLTLEMARAGYEKKVFTPFGASRIINQMENEDRTKHLMGMKK